MYSRDITITLLVTGLCHRFISLTALQSIQAVPDMTSVLANPQPHTYSDRLYEPRHIYVYYLADRKISVTGYLSFRDTGPTTKSGIYACLLVFV